MSTKDTAPTATTEIKPATSTTPSTTGASTGPATAAGGQKDVEQGSARMAAASSSETHDTSGSHGTSADKSAKDMAQETKDAAAARASELTERARHEAAGLGDKAKGMAAEKAEEAKGYATSEIDRQAESLRAAGREFGEDSYQAHAADYLARNLSQAADMIRDKDMSSLVDDVSLFARRNPALFLGGAALLGFAAVRLMKATERTGSSRSWQDDDARFAAPSPGIANTPYGQPAQPARPNGGFQQ